MQKTDQLANVFFTELRPEARHFALDAIGNQRRDACVRLLQRRQARSFLSAARVVAVTVGAVREKQIVATGGGCRLGAA